MSELATPDLPEDNMLRMYDILLSEPDLGKAIEKYCVELEKEIKPRVEALVEDASATGTSEFAISEIMLIVERVVEGALTRATRVARMRLSTEGESNE